MTKMVMFWTLFKAAGKTNKINILNELRLIFLWLFIFNFGIINQLQRGAVMKISNVFLILSVLCLLGMSYVMFDVDKNKPLFQTASYDGVLTKVESQHSYKGGEIFQGTIVVDGKTVVKKVTLENFVKFVQNDKKPTPITVDLSAADFGADVSTVYLNSFPILVSLFVAFFLFFASFLIDYGTRKGYIEHWETV